MSLVEIALKEAEAYYNQYGTSLTLRGLFYILVSKNVIPNTVSAYKSFQMFLQKLDTEESFLGISSETLHVE